ncbi:unnamed protein product [Thlaspi arvense]|uniref:Protein kinase domain-containing protein n=1 Tax=Thlaspi arvense TaxID=13288 RepID=A0AAU9RJP0_THLAR|nr:unnamed protein product [Thlaspi arvense]
MKSDVYAFGVVLLEVLCGRPAVDLRYEDDDDRSSLALWAQQCIKRGALDKIVDPSLMGQISSNSLELFGEIANKCIHSHPRGRPTMAEVVASLELVLASEQDHLNARECKDELILVYEFTPHGSLYDHLYTRKNDSLPWKKRLEIGIGVARGLHYLYSGIKQTIIHQNLNASAILLDENWEAKLVGFEYSTIVPTNISRTSPKNIVRCQVGYLDPECLESGILTVKSDVYSFGVILLELLCGRKPMIVSQDEDKVNLVRWFKTNLELDVMDQIVDPCLMDKIAPECLKEYVNIATNCVRDEGIERPTIEDVLGSLGSALQLQQNWEYSKKLCDEIDKNRDVGGMSFVSLGDSDNCSSNLAR